MHDLPISSEKRILKIREMNKIQLHNTELSFLEKHKGIRPGKTHVLIASSGSGKSALMRKIISDTSKTSRCLIWLSEEDRDEFSESITLLDLENMQNIRIVSEDDFAGVIGFSLLEKFKEVCIGSFNGDGAEVVFFDNITTSDILTNRINDDSRIESSLINFFKSTLVSDTPMALWVIAHAKKDIPQINYYKFMSIEDVRGSQTICSKSQHAYTLQIFVDENQERYSIIKTHKQRGYDTDEKYYSLIYNRAMKSFQKSTEVSYQYVKEVFKRRQKL
jgi:ABC-type dipeptide/oligopeptide/nickel transport system ATPase component